MSNILPIGSVIRIKNSKERYIILGRNIEHNNKKYDYMCAIYPYGFFEDMRLEYHNDVEVESLCFLGDINGL